MKPCMVLLALYVCQREQLLWAAYWMRRCLNDRLVIDDSLNTQHSILSSRGLVCPSVTADSVNATSLNIPGIPTYTRRTFSYPSTNTENMEGGDFSLMGICEIETLGETKKVTLHFKNQRGIKLPIGASYVDIASGSLPADIIPTEEIQMPIVIFINDSLLEGNQQATGRCVITLDGRIEMHQMKIHKVPELDIFSFEDEIKDATRVGINACSVTYFV